MKRLKKRTIQVYHGEMHGNYVKLELENIYSIHQAKDKTKRENDVKRLEVKLQELNEKNMEC